MIFLYTRNDVPNYPFWLLHLESLTLAKLTFAPEGPILHIRDEVEPSGPVLTAFLDAGTRLGCDIPVTVTSMKLPHDFPACLCLAPEQGTGLVIFNHAAGLALPWTQESGVMDPLWKKLPASPSARAISIRQTVELADVAVKNLLEAHLEGEHVADLWLQRADQLASSS